MHYGGRRALTPAQQFLFLRNNPICAGEGRLSHKGLAWSYRARPYLLSREYAVKIAYDGNESPRVFVTNPDLTTLAGGRDLPHVYKHPTRLCLYLPGSGEWADTMRIDETFVPWTATWLYFFEEWLESNDWKGGGEHPSDSDETFASRRTRRLWRHSTAVPA
jgi:hypothetical protein